MTTRLLRLIPILLLILASACSRAPVHQPLPRGSLVLAIGDSVTYGVGANPGEDYPTQLAALTGWVVNNHGVSGETSDGTLARIDDVLSEARPALVILEIGGNDFLRRMPNAGTRDNIRAIVQRVKQAGVPVVLVAVPTFSLFGAAGGSLPDAPLYAELAESEKVPLVPSIFAEVLSTPTLRADQVHPNAAGYQKLAEGIAAELRALGYLK